MDTQQEQKNTLDPDLQFEALLQKIRENTHGMDLGRIRAAYDMARVAHSGQLRRDGSPYVTHCIAAADISVDIGLDEDSIIAALLHDVIEDTNLTHEDIARQFGPAVADIVEGVTKLTRVQYTSKEDEQAENLRKMLMAMAKDIRVILIKIADRLHNMRTMAYQSPEKQKTKSLETMEIYAPIAHRLGMQRAKWELEVPRPRGLQGDHRQPDPAHAGAGKIHGQHEAEDPEPSGERERAGHHLLPHQTRLLHLPQDVRPEAGHQRHFRPLRLPRDRRLHPRLL